MSEKSIRWFCPICNDFISIRKTEELKQRVIEVKHLPYPIIIKHGNPPHYTILQLDRDLRDRGRLTCTDFINLTEERIDLQEKNPKIDVTKETLEQVSEELSIIQRKIWDLLGS